MTDPTSIVVDVRRALGEGMPAGVQSPVGARDLEALVPMLSAAADLLDRREEQREVGFLRLDHEGWGLPDVRRVATALRERADVLLVLGIGGSALGARALDRALGPDSGRAEPPPTVGKHRVEVLDTVDPSAVRQMLVRLDPARTAVAVISKSGGTVETIALWRVVQPWLVAAVGDQWTQQVVVVTDTERGDLRDLADSEGLASLPVPPDVGGRFSVLTAVGMLPAAFLGLDVDGMVAGAAAMAARVRRRDLASNPAWAFAGIHHAWYAAGARVSVLAAWSARCRTLGDWYAQLWAESLGKLTADGTSVGWTPSPAEGPADQHSQLQLWQQGPRDKLICALGVTDPGPDIQVGNLPGAADVPGRWVAGRGLGEILEAERRGTIAALVQAGRPVVELTLPRVDEASVAGLIVLFEAATALAGHMLGVDPFDQPGVEGGKRFACGLLGRPGYESDGEVARLLLGD